MELDDLLAQHSVPGISIGTFKDGEEQYASAGVRSAEDPVSITEDTLFRVASITKTFTAAALMRLVVDGAVDLDAAVRTYLPEFKVADEDVAAQVTLRDLVTHRAGWTDNGMAPIPPTDHDDEALKRGVATLADAEQLLPFRRFFSYNNSAFAVVGRVIEVASGRPYEDVIRAYVTDPMGLRRTVFFADDAITFPVAIGHTGSPAQVVRPWWRSRASAPQGGLMSTARDLIAYARHLLDGNVLEPELVAELWRPHAEGARSTDAVGVAWKIENLRDGRRVVSHEGHTRGFGSKLAIEPDRRAAYVALINSDSAQDAVYTVLREVMGTAPPPFGTVETPELAPYLGVYTDGNDVARVRADGYLDMADEPPEMLGFTGVDEAFANGRLVRFLRDDDGTVSWLGVGGQVYRRTS